jgi:hypothetical protein
MQTKKGCEDEFKNVGLKRLTEFMNRPDKNVTWSIIELGAGKIVQLRRNESIDAIIDAQVGGVESLDSVNHLLEKDKEGSRTQEYSGLEMDFTHLF